MEKKIKKSYEQINQLIQEGRIDELENFMKNVNKNIYINNFKHKIYWKLNLVSFVLNHYIEEAVSMMNPYLQPHDVDHNYLTNDNGWDKGHDFDDIRNGDKYELKRKPNFRKIREAWLSHTERYHGADYIYWYDMEEQDFYLQDPKNRIVDYIFNLDDLYECSDYSDDVSKIIRLINFYTDLYNKLYKEADIIITYLENCAVDHLTELTDIELMQAGYQATRLLKLKNKSC